MAIRCFQYMLGVLLFLSGCSGNEGSGTSQESFPVLQDTLLKNIVNDSNQIDLPSRKGQLLIIENCAALWPVSCGTENVDSNFSDSVKTYFGSTDWISFGRGYPNSVTIDSIFCMQGECGGNQIAIKLSGDECLGVMAANNLISKHEGYIPLSRISPDAVPPNRLMQSDSSYARLMTYSDRSGLWSIQCFGEGSLQENDWPFMSVWRWRIINSVGVSDEFPWQTAALKSTNLPEPLGMIVGNASMRVVWRHGEGICCPSYSKAWISTVLKGGGEQRISNGTTSIGGLGQPCD